MHKTIYALITRFAGLFIPLILAGCSVTLPNRPPIGSHSVTKLNRLIEIWSLENVGVEHNDFTSWLISNNRKVVLLGRLEDFTDSRLLCLDGLDGRLLWKENTSSTASALVNIGNEVYVGFSGVPHVTRFALDDGKVIWDQPLKGRGLRSLFILDDEIQVGTDPYIHTVLDREDGKIIQSIRNKRPPQDIYIRTEDETFSRPMSVTLTKTGELIWKQNLDREVTLPPIFLTDLVLIRTNRVMGKIYALSRSTGEIRWKTDNNIISNIAYSNINNKLFALSRDGKLIEIDVATGDQAVLAEFSSSPFVLVGEQEVGGYAVAYDESSYRLFVLFGDSQQLFAFIVTE